MPKIMVCKFCEEEFELRPGKSGSINVCCDPKCISKDIKEPPKLGGNMIWYHKTAPDLEIKSISEAVTFAKQTARMGTGITSCLSNGHFNQDK